MQGFLAQFCFLTLSLLLIFLIPMPTKLYARIITFLGGLWYLAFSTYTFLKLQSRPVRRRSIVSIP